MPINDPTIPAGLARRPRARVLVGGAELPGVFDITVNQPNYYHAAKFSVTAALETPNGYGMRYWGDVSAPLAVQIDVGFLPPGVPEGTAATYTTLLSGEADNIDPDPIKGTVIFDGRDLTSRLIEAKTQEAFPNQTASDVATLLAQRHGLTPFVTGTSTLIGRYYEQDHEHLTLGQFHHTTTEWDLLVWLAQREGMDVYVQGNNLVFAPLTPANSDPWIVNWVEPDPYPRANVLDFQPKRSLVLAKDIEVVVLAWHSQKAQLFTRSAPPGISNYAVNSNKAQRYVFGPYPNMLEDKAQKLANQLQADLSKHEMVIRFTAPGDVNLTARDLVRVQGTNSSWDQTYYIDQITWRLSWDEGFLMDVSAKNHSTLSQTAIAS